MKKISFEKLKEDYKPLCVRLKEILDYRIEDVNISDRLVNESFSIVTSQFGMSANMERIMKAQALSDSNMLKHMTSKKHLEINPHNKIIQSLKNRINNKEEDRSVESLVTLLFDTALLNAGFSLDDPKTFS